MSSSKPPVSLGAERAKRSESQVSSHSEALGQGFPATRMRRNRRADWSRRMVAENVLTSNDLIWPIFVTAGKNACIPVESMPGVDRLTVDLAVEAAKQAVD